MNWNQTVVVLTAIFLTGCDNEAPPTTPAPTTATAPAADINAGKVTATRCAHCHPADNVTTQSARPFLAGQQAQYLALALKSYTDGSRTHKAMQPHAQGLSEQEIVNVAAWYASLTAPWKGAAPATPPDDEIPDPALVAAGQKASRHCGSCHGTDGNSTKAGTPSLAGLQPEYVTKALHGYFSGERSDPIMNLFKESLGPQEIKAIAAYFARQARTRTTVPSNGNAVAGKAKAAACAGCHGTDGNSINAAMPSLAGQNGPYLEKALLAYHSGQRKDGMMQSAVKPFKPNELRDLAAFYATQEPRRFGEVRAAPNGAFDPIGDGERLAQNCNGCHGEGGNSRKPGVPSLSRLHSDYLMTALKAYRDGARSDGLMKSFAVNLSDDDITRVALYYATREPKPALKIRVTGIAAGEKLAATCAGCHGEHGNSKMPATPSLAGQDGAYLIAAIKAYTHNTRQHADMQNAVKSLKDAEVAQVAAYYAAQTAVKPEVRIPEAPDVLAQKCNRCHGDDGVSTDPKIPRIAGQSGIYLAEALHAYQSGARNNSAMKAMADMLSAVEIKAVAAYYARKP